MTAITSEEDEERRLRQVHQYLSLRDAENEKRIEVTKVESPDTALTAFTQLVAWRMDAQRAIVSLVDRSDQYFIAESTPTLNLKNTANSDWLWVGCTGSTTRDVALCAQTIKATEPLKGYSCFFVTDLKNNPGYNHLPYVVGPPYFRYYCGTPLVTEDGFRIGSLFVIDQRPREEGPSEDQINFLGVMAANVMQHLDNQREAERRKRIMIMSKGMAAFTEGKHRIDSEWKEQNHADTGTSTAHAQKIDLRRGCSTFDGTEKKVLTVASSKQPNTGSRQTEGKKPGKENKDTSADGEMTTHASVLARASNLLRESLDVAFSVFLDTSKGGSRVVRSVQMDSRALNHGAKSQSSYRSQAGKDKFQPANVLSFSTSQSSSSSQDDASSANFQQMDARMIRRLLKKYPNGYLWSFDRSGHEIVVEKEEKSTYISSDSETQTKQYRPASKEGSMLMNCFRGARQVLYAPIFDIATSRSVSACFAVSMREVPAFSTDVEVTWLRAFLNNVAVEWDRVSVSIADRQKGDFLSSISHEFRSPLHGILASTELLSDSKLEDSERALCETIQSCGETLLHTVCHILDYTKVNDLNHRLAEARNEGDFSPNSDGAAPEERLSSIALFADIDVAAICESAIQSVCVGSTFDRRMSEIQVPHEQPSAGNAALFGLPDASNAVSSQQGSVAVILNISAGAWVFHCAPGTIQRILMNLVGNSLKYTKAGHIEIKIEEQAEMLYQPEGERGHSQITITVTDTGIGISKDFLRYKLFTPFSQESAVAAGTGLGMSMVKKIVQSLEGEIHVDSEINQGTQVTVHFPLSPASSHSEQDQHNPSGHSKLPPNPVSMLRVECPDKTVAFFGFETASTILLKDSVEFYLTEWYHFSIIRDVHRADFVIVDETSLDDIFSRFAGNALPQRIVTLRSTTIRDKSLPTAIHSVLKPVGPYALAKVLLNCWTRTPPRTPETEVPLPPTMERKPIQKESEATTTAPVHELPKPSTLTVSAKNDRETSDETKVAPSVALAESKPISTKPLPEIQVVLLPTPPKPLEMRPSRKKEPKVSVQEVELPQQPRILCVDDNPINLKVLQAYLKKLEKKNVKFAENGLEAFKAVESSGDPFDLIFMDLSMPVCDGFESTARIRKLEKQRRKVQHPVGARTSFIIALTGQASSRDQDQAFASGVDKFVTKPMSLSHLKGLFNDLEAAGKIGSSQADSEEKRWVDVEENSTAVAA